MSTSSGQEQRKKSNGFTLIEILLVIGLIAVLATITIVALNPTRQYGQANDSTRVSHVNAILNAVNQYSLDNKGIVPSVIPTGTCTSTPSAEICQTGSACATGVDLGVLTASEIYIVSVPIDPIVTSATGTGYRVTQSSNGRVTVCAPNSYTGEDIIVTR